MTRDSILVPLGALMMMHAITGMAAEGIRIPSAKRIHVVLIAGQSNAVGFSPGRELPTEPVNLQNPQENILFYQYIPPSPPIWHPTAKDRVDLVNAPGTLGTLGRLSPGSRGPYPKDMSFGPEITLGYRLAPAIEKRPGDTLAIVKFGVGATGIDHWVAPEQPLQPWMLQPWMGECYRIFQRVAKDGLAALRAEYPGADVQIAAMVWVQGESDSLNLPMAKVYGDKLTRLIGDVRKTFGDSLPFVLSRLSDQQVKYASPDSPTHAGFLEVRRCQEQVAATVPNVYLVDTDGPRFSVCPDRMHFSAAGQQALGAAFAEKIEAILAGVRQARKQQSFGGTKP